MFVLLEDLVAGSGGGRILELLHLLALFSIFWVFVWTAVDLWHEQIDGPTIKWTKIQRALIAISRCIRRAGKGRYQKRRRRRRKKILSSLSSTTWASFSSLNSAWTSSSIGPLPQFSRLERSLPSSPATPWEAGGTYLRTLPRLRRPGLKELGREFAAHDHVEFNLHKKQLPELWGGPTPHSESLANLFSVVPRRRQRASNTTSFSSRSSEGKWSPRRTRKDRAETPFPPLVPKTGPKFRPQDGMPGGLVDQPLARKVRESKVSSDVLNSCVSDTQKIRKQGSEMNAPERKSQQQHQSASEEAPGSIPQGAATSTIYTRAASCPMHRLPEARDPCVGPLPHAAASCLLPRSPPSVKTSPASARARVPLLEALLQGDTCPGGRPSLPEGPTQSVQQHRHGACPAVGPEAAQPGKGNPLQSLLEEPTPKTQFPAKQASQPSIIPTQTNLQKVTYGRKTTKDAAKERTEVSEAMKAPSWRPVCRALEEDQEDPHESSSQIKYKPLRNTTNQASCHLMRWFKKKRAAPEKCPTRPHQAPARKKDQDFHRSEEERPRTKKQNILSAFKHVWDGIRGRRTKTVKLPEKQASAPLPPKSGDAANMPSSSQIFPSSKSDKMPPKPSGKWEAP